jgi:hypothetical protein
MVAKLPSAEEWIAEIDHLIASFGESDRPLRTPTREQIIERLRKLGLTEGDALRYLSRRRHR